MALKPHTPAKQQLRELAEQGHLRLSAEN